LLAILGLVALAGAVPTASTRIRAGQDGEAAPRMLLVRGAKVIVRPGKVLEQGAVLVQDGVIVNVGRDLEAPADAKVVEGAVVCAGFLDAWSSFALESNAFADERINSATLATDAVDSYLDPRFETQILRAGITSYRLQPSVGARVGGLGAFLRLHPGKRSDQTTLLEDCCVAGSLGLSRDGRSVDVFDRVSEVDRLLGALSDGLGYLQDQNEYRHELEDWQKKIADKQKELDEGFKKAKKDREKAQTEAKDKGTEFKEKEFKEDKKPKAPRYDPEKEVLARVASGELPLVVEVHRALELRNLLDGTEKIERLRLIVAGGTEALTCAESLKERRIPVIVWPQPQGTGRSAEFESSDMALAAALEEAGVEVILGSGGAAGIATRDLPLLTAMAVGHGMSAQSALAALTTRPARAFDVSDKVGSLDLGREADILVLSGEPFATTTKVRFVISGGDLVVEER
jgi:imidazolonepropionase-like amidohydrolase